MSEAPRKSNAQEPIEAVCRSLRARKAETPPGPGPYAWRGPTAPVVEEHIVKTKIEELTKERDELKASVNRWFGKGKALLAENDALRVENDVLNKTLDGLKKRTAALEHAAKESENQFGETYRAAARVYEHGTRLDKVPSHHGRRLRVINVGWDPEGDHGL